MMNYESSGGAYSIHNSSFKIQHSIATMQLTSLEIFGFKSFAERTKFVFDDGITGYCRT